METPEAQRTNSSRIGYIGCGLILKRVGMIYAHAEVAKSIGNAVWASQPSESANSSANTHETISRQVLSFCLKKAIVLSQESLADAS